MLAGQRATRQRRGVQQRVQLEFQRHLAGRASAGGPAFRPRGCLEQGGEGVFRCSGRRDGWVVAGGPNL
eukprot:11193120-Lingulodinium_polyedra.AAC.1